ncbi:MAG: MBOAT family protein [Clostridia bacterium]|nr:MBOAT family protein [Clostridia bacterium]
MVFSSLIFICIFLPFTVILHTTVKNTVFRNALLLIVSLFFYAYGEPVYVLLMILCSLINYVFAFGASCDNKKLRTLFLALCVVSNLGILAFFKYSDMAVASVNGIFGTDIPLPGIRLPIGISFFTFQALSYTIDVYRNSTKVQKNFFKLLLYVSFFPQLIAGPIVKYIDVEKEIDERAVSVDGIERGLGRFIAGLSKKVLISNTMGFVADSIYALDESGLGMAVAWLGAITYMLQIYYDFSGYSDMAIGLGEVFGFHFKENFNHPYLADSMTDFWRRWHISLSTWFKEYLYIPLGGNRKGKIRTDINKFIVFFSTGLWHGASWTFVLWGLSHGFFLIVENHFSFIKKMPKVLRHIYTLFVVCLTFVLFRAESFTQAWLFFRNMFGFTSSAASLSILSQQLTPWFIFILVFAILCIFPRERIIRSAKAVAITEKVKYAVYILLFAFCIIRISSEAYNPFIYFRF